MAASYTCGCGREDDLRVVRHRHVIKVVCNRCRLLIGVRVHFPKLKKVEREAIAKAEAEMTDQAEVART